ncbi:MAG: hypothetical protein R3E09_03640 [Novosphingobium sp.]
MVAPAHQRGYDLDLIAWAHGEGFDITLIEVMPLGEVEEDRLTTTCAAVRRARDRLERQRTLTANDHRTGGLGECHVDVAETGGRLTTFSLTNNFCDGCN